MDYNHLKGKLVSFKELASDLNSSKAISELLMNPRRGLGTFVLLALAFPGKLYMPPKYARELNVQKVMGNMMSFAMQQAMKGNMDPEAMKKGGVDLGIDQAKVQEYMKDFELYVDAYDLLKFNNTCFTVFGGKDDQADLVRKLENATDHASKIGGTLEGVDAKAFIDGMGRQLAPMAGMAMSGKGPFGGGGRGPGGGKGPVFN